MTFLRASVVLSAACTLLVACGGGGAKNPNGGTGGGSGSGTGGSSGTGPRTCAPAGGATNTCTQAEMNAYATCVQNACDADYKACLGPNYRSGTYSGVCGTYFNCFNACACNDTACVIACGTPGAECQSCLVQLATCSGTCPVPACYSTTAGTGGSSGGGTGGSSGGGTGGSGAGGTACADLLACCNASTDAPTKASCLSSYNAVMSAGNASCAQLLTAIKPSICP